MTTEPAWDAADHWPPPPEDDRPDAYIEQLDELDSGMRFAKRVASIADDIRARDAARALVAAEKAEQAPPFDAGTLGEVLARPADPPHRVEHLIPSEAGTLLVAMRKTGKTTTTLNLARSLITGEDFLGTFGVRKVDGKVGFLNYEVSAAQLSRWAHEHGLDVERFFLVNLRGRRNPLALPEDRQMLASLLRQHEVESLIVDPFGRAFTGQNQNDAGEVGAWLADLDRFTRGETGALDLILTAHAGWAGERTRGSTALEDWADSIITLTRDKGDDTQRFFKAMGRDVDIDEDALTFDPDTRTLALAGLGSRRQVSNQNEAAEWVDEVVAFIETNPESNQTTICEAFKIRPATIRQATDMAVARGLITRTAKGRSKLHSVPIRPGGIRPNPSQPQPLESQHKSVSVPIRPDPSQGPIPYPSHPSIGTDRTGRTNNQTCDTCSQQLLLTEPDRTTCAKCDRSSGPPRAHDPERNPMDDNTESENP